MKAIFFTYSYAAVSAYKGRKISQIYITRSREQIEAIT